LRRQLIEPLTGADAAGCKLSDTAGGEAGKAGREACSADDAMDFEGDEAGGEADGKAAAGADHDLGGADRCGACTASGCEADGEAGGAGRGELGEAGREVCGANDGTDVDGDETGGEANALVVADPGREADGSEDCGNLMARTPNLAMCAASCSPSSVRWVQVQPLQPLQPLLPLLPLRPLHPLQLQLQPSRRRCPSALGRA